MDVLQRTDHRTHCPFKGDASYWTIEVGGRKAANAAWSYEDPLEDGAPIKDYIAFDSSQVDAWYEDGRPVVAEAETGVAADNPYVDWLVREAWRAQTSAELVAAFSERLVDAGLPLLRFGLLIRTLHPEMFAVGYNWWRDRDGVSEYQTPYDVLLKSEYLDSPYAPILKGVGGVRRRLDGPDPTLDFPILEELKKQGATDYAAMPLAFSDQQINIITLVSDRPGGFTTSDLGHVYEVLPLLARLFEIHSLRRLSGVLLETYLGKHTGPRVLDGLIKRGDGETIHAVIWFCDLRNSTALTESMPREAYLDLLNEFFECMAGPVLDHGGEVLKYIGDAVLAIFPTGDTAEAHARAAGDALAAAQDARDRIAAVNRQRTARGEPPLGFGIALHRGEFTYGNVGTAGRLDFTVIGAAANEAARIEGMSKALGEPILLSEAFAESLPHEVPSLGRHKLRGVGEAQEIFTLPG